MTEHIDIVVRIPKDQQFQEGETCPLEDCRATVAAGMVHFRYPGMPKCMDVPTHS